jgi:N-acetylglucosaminyldiphosphoundecaprenol N-acetyl-beta-D-mannosaminyltransferase
MKIKRIDILGVKVSVLTYETILKNIEECILNAEKKYVCVSAVHLLMECQKDEELRVGVNRADVVTTDGMPLVWVLNYLKGEPSAKRVYGPELMLRLCSLANQKDYSVFFLGGSIGESSKLAKTLKEKFCELKIAGNMDTPIRPIPNNKKVLDAINESEAQIVFVGMGCPNQEKWMIENRNKLKANVLIGVGAAFDFITGKEKQAPKWMQNGGLEWFFRLMQNPKRLWYRYLVLNTQFVYLISKHILKKS